MPITATGGASTSELAEVQRRFGLHDLAVEDAQSFHLRPKIEQYDEGGVYFAVLRTARYVDEREAIEFGEVSVFISSRFVITVRQGVASDLHEARLRLERRPELLRRAPPRCCGRSSTRSSTTTRPSLKASSTTSRRSSRPCSAAPRRPTERIYFLRREATDFYRAVHPLLGPLEGLERGTYLPVSHELSQFFRDVNDHLKLVNEEVIAQRDLLAIILQANMAVISVAQNEIGVRQNETTKQLTLVATIFLPLSLHRGLLRHELRLDGRPHHLAVGVPAVRRRKPRASPPSLLYVWFRRSGHLGAT